jgi:hypothetical protein
VMALYCQTIRVIIGRGDLWVVFSNDKQSICQILIEQCHLQISHCYPTSPKVCCSSNHQPSSQLSSQRSQHCLEVGNSR